LSFQYSDVIARRINRSDDRDKDLGFPDFLIEKILEIYFQAVFNTMDDCRKYQQNEKMKCAEVAGPTMKCDSAEKVVEE
jgi:hypothetical protein